MCTQSVKDESNDLTAVSVSVTVFVKSCSSVPAPPGPAYHYVCFPGPAGLAGISGFYFYNLVNSNTGALPVCLHGLHPYYSQLPEYQEKGIQHCLVLRLS